eukprot:8163520-Ditylum_brightwellii.AAC.1
MAQYIDEHYMLQLGHKGRDWMKMRTSGAIYSKTHLRKKGGSNSATSSILGGKKASLEDGYPCPEDGGVLESKNGGSDDNRETAALHANICL